MTVLTQTIKYSALSIMLLLAIILCVFLVLRTYSSDPIHGIIADYDSGKPIKGALVVAYWEQRGGIVHEQTTGYLALEETKTSDTGEFYVEQWGPKVSIKGYISDRSPILLIYKHGYTPLFLHNTDNEPYGLFQLEADLNMPGLVEVSIDESGTSLKTIKIKRFSGNLEEYAKDIDYMQLDRLVENYWSITSCEWEKLPMYVAEIVNLKKYFNDQGIRINLPSLEMFEYKNCRDPKELTNAYLAK